MLHADIHFKESHTLDDQLREFWELVALGIRDREEKLYYEFTGGVKLKNWRIEIPLPWRKFHYPLSDNYQLNLHRLQGLLHQLKQDPTVPEEYDDIIKNQMKMEIIEAIPDGDPLSNVHYMLHHTVVRRGSSTMKLHVVYYVSAKTANSPSLNDCLLKDPKLN